MDRLINEGLTLEQATGSMLCLMVWRNIDFKGHGLWKSAGPKVYDLFSDRIKASCSAPTLMGFVCRLGRKCGVTNPRLQVPGIKRLIDPSAINQEEVFRELKHNTGIIVAGLRRYIEINKEINNAE